MGELNLHPPEHPRFPSNAAALRDPHRQPTPHERRILEVFMRYKNVPDFEKLAAPSPEQVDQASRGIEEIAAQAPDPLRDQDERVLDLLGLIADYPEVFGRVGYFLAAEVMSAARNNIETAEFRRAFFSEYGPAMENVRDYLRRAANLRRRSLGSKYAAANVPQGIWRSAERRAAAKEQMELVQALPDYYFMEKFWRTIEIVCSYPDFFSKDQYDQLISRKGIDQTWKAHLAKAREDLTFYRGIIHTGGLFRQIVDSALEVLRRAIKERQDTSG